MALATTLLVAGHIEAAQKTAIPEHSWIIDTGPNKSADLAIIFEKDYSFPCDGPQRQWQIEIEKKALVGRQAALHDELPIGGR